MSSADGLLPNSAVSLAQALDSPSPVLRAAVCPPFLCSSLAPHPDCHDALLTLAVTPNHRVIAQAVHRLCPHQPAVLGWSLLVGCPVVSFQTFMNVMQMPRRQVLLQSSTHSFRVSHQTGRSLQAVMQLPSNLNMGRAQATPATGLLSSRVPAGCHSDRQAVQGRPGHSLSTAWPAAPAGR